MSIHLDEMVVSLLLQEMVMNFMGGMDCNWLSNRRRDGGGHSKTKVDGKSERGKRT